MSVTYDELLRLARKAWPDTASHLRLPGEEDPLSVDYTEYDCTARVHNPYEEDSCGLVITHPTSAREAMHAALLVLAGEDADLRDRLDRALAASERDRAARGRAVNTTQLLTSLCERAVATLVRLGHADDASELQEALASALRDRA